MFLVGQMADDPAYAVHWLEPASGFFICDAVQTT
jgi:hypothetical protein